jgi:predicted DNA binding CopG/RHH family protein
MQFEFGAKTATLNMCLPQSLLEALKAKAKVKAKAKAKGIPSSRYVRLLLESDVAR